MKKISQKGLSILEVILASAIFITFASGAAITVIQGLNSNRQGAEFTVATQYAAEGIEAVKSIKNQAYATLTPCPSAPSTTGVIRDGVTFTWKCNGINDSITHNSGDNYIRTIQIDPV